jgi:hypothetical protein
VAIADDAAIAATLEPGRDAAAEYLYLGAALIIDWLARAVPA